MKQLITITPTGEIETLQRKKGVGVDIGPLVDKKRIKRISLVEWDEGHQMWFIRFQLGPLAGAVLTLARVQFLTGAPLHELDCPHCNQATEIEGNFMGCLWEDYDDAVKCEVAVIETARANGKGVLVGSAA